MSFSVYILLCADGAYYVGHTSDLKDRIACHNAGRGATFTAARLPVTLVYSEIHSTESDAATRELQLKKWSHAKKAALVHGERQRLHALSISRDHKKPIPPLHLAPPSVSTLD